MTGYRRKMVALFLAAVLCFSVLSVADLALNRKASAAAPITPTVAAAVKILRSLTGLYELTAQEKGDYDVNLDGKITIADAVMVLKACIGLVSLPDRPDPSDTEESAVTSTESTFEPSSESSAELSSEPESSEEPAGYVKRTDLPATNYTLNGSILENSLMNIGKTARMAKALDKAANGEEVTVAFIGGSITEGDGVTATTCYPALVVDWMKTKFNNPNIKLVNAGISGTPSKLGVMRAQPHVIDKNPDIVFIEFAVNDGTDKDSNIAYESLIRKLLKSESAPAVGLIFTVLKGGYSNQANMSATGQHYSLPMVSVVNSIYKEINAGRMAWSDYSNDDAHPHLNGHKYLAQLVEYCMEQIYDRIESAPASYTMPATAKVGNDYEDIVFANRDNLEPTQAGGYNLVTSDIAKFPNGWKKSPTSGNDSFIATFNAKEIFMIYWETPGYGNPAGGKADIYVNGVLTATINANKNWGNPQFSSLIRGTATTEYTIEIRVSSGSAANPFWILGFAYTP